MVKMKRIFIIFIIFILTICIEKITSGFVRLDENVTLEWSYGYTEKQLWFQIVAETSDPTDISLGFSKDGTWETADIVAGTTYPFSSLEDRHGTYNGKIEVDSVQDYALVNAAQNESHTRIFFTRPINSCDSDDYPITTDTTKLLWNVGPSEEKRIETYHKKFKSINFLTQMNTLPPNTFESFNLTMYPKLEGLNTTFWCGFFNTLNMTDKSSSAVPSVENDEVSDDWDLDEDDNEEDDDDDKIKKVWIVAFEPIFDKMALAHIHHMDIYLCNAAGDELYPNFIDGNCEDFYETNTKRGDYCLDPLILSWSNGGEIAVFPNDIGLTLNPNQYYVLHAHLDNPSKLTDIEFTAGFRMYYTTEPRENEAGQLQIGTMEEKIPPNSVNHTTAARFDPSSSSNFRTDGITIFGLTFHTHRSGVRMKLRHFQDGLELPPILSDSNYDFAFQQAHILPTPVKVEHGDQLVLECTYNTTWKMNKTVENGFTTSDEMCMAMLLYYPKVETDFSFWDSSTDSYQMSTSDLENFLGITATDYDDDLNKIVTSPKKWKGWTISEVFEHGFDWTDEARAEYQRLNMEYKYPEYLTEYVPPNPCLKTIDPSPPSEDDNDNNNLLDMAEQLNNGIGVVNGNIDNLRKNIERLQDRATDLTFELTTLQETVKDLTTSVDTLTRQLYSVLNPPIIPDPDDESTDTSSSSWKKFYDNMHFDSLDYKFALMLITLSVVLGILAFGAVFGAIVMYRKSFGGSNKNGKKKSYSYLSFEDDDDEIQEGNALGKGEHVVYENKIRVEEDDDDDVNLF